MKHRKPICMACKHLEQRGTGHACGARPKGCVAVGIDLKWTRQGATCPMGMWV